MEKEKKVYWPYNETFGFYHDVPLAGKRAEQFIARMNPCKGGRWILHTVEQYDEWYERKGQHLQYLGLYK